MAEAVQTDLALTASQSEALRRIETWLDSPGDRKVFRLHGYAGTGKSTLARRAAALAGSRALFGAFTGKAAQVLRGKGCPAKTIHSMLYVVVPKSSGRYKEMKEQLQDMEAQGATIVETRPLRASIEAEAEKLRKPRFSINLSSPIKDAPLLVLDEVSMIGQQMVNDLTYFQTPILALGDPAQLPPVRASDGYFTSGTPDFMLTEIMRQAADSPILELATLARQKKPLPVGFDRDGTRVLKKGSLTLSQLLTDFDQIICGTNANRRALNRALRAHMGRTDPIPQPGDRLICLKNDADQGLLNGSQWEVKWAANSGGEVAMDLKALDPGAECDEMVVTADPGYFLEDGYKGSPFSELQAFDFANAVTCHKAQGSEWDRVLVIDESRVFRADAHRWKYTAITRAAKEVTVTV